MNAFFLLVVVAIIGFAFWFQKLSVSAHDADNRAAIELAEKSGTSPQPSAASNGQTAAHSYMKGALDRARDVRDQGRARTQAAQDPDSEK